MLGTLHFLWPVMLTCPAVLWTPGHNDSVGREVTKETGAKIYWHYQQQAGCVCVCVVMLCFRGKSDVKTHRSFREIFEHQDSPSERRNRRSLGWLDEIYFSNIFEHEHFSNAGFQSSFMSVDKRWPRYQDYSRGLFLWAMLWMNIDPSEQWIPLMICSATNLWMGESVHVVRRLLSLELVVLSWVLYK